MNEYLTLRLERNPSALGPEWDRLFAEVSEPAVIRAWLEATIEAALLPGSVPTLLALSDRAGPLALMPMLEDPSRSFGSLTTPYTCLYQTFWRSDLIKNEAALDELGSWLKRWPTVRFEALDPNWAGLPVLRAILVRAGFACRTFSHFVNWHESVTPGDWHAFLQRRPGALRETIRRKTRAADRSGDRIHVARERSELRNAIDAYEHVHRKSWKQPEPFPRFNRALVRNLADTGVLRIGTMWNESKPIAAQYWCVTDGAATILKLAHDETFKASSPGTVLTAATIRELIEVDRVSEVDFGRGDDAYKRDWAGQRRARIGLIALDVRRVAGLRTLLLHDAGMLLRRARRRWREMTPVSPGGETSR